MRSAGIFRLLYVMSVFTAGGDISREISIYQIAAFWFICLLLCVLDAVRPSSAAIEGESKVDFKKNRNKSQIHLDFIHKTLYNKKVVWKAIRRHSSVGQSARFTSVRSQVRALLSPPSRAWSQTRSKRLLIFIKCTRDKAGIFFSSSIQRDAGPNLFWVQRYFLCLTARPNSS